jgi:cytochrome oxidase Cu insertion factor (SCO1/SenC/PrrC family)
MPGMDSGLDAVNPALVAAFRSALLTQLGIVAVIAAVLLLAHVLTRHWQDRAQPVDAPLPDPQREPAARRFLRISFGILWILDGILQAQPRMAGGLPSHVIEPIAAVSPQWVQHVVNAGGTIWSYHPVQAAAAAVWIQAGLGLWLIAAGAGKWSRLAGLATVAWGLIVWVFGEAFGGIFAPGLSWLTGAPGAVLLYVIAAALIALPPRAWAGPRLGRLLLGGAGAFWAGMAVLQAWPGRGFWQGGTLAAMTQSMALAPQPHGQADLLSAFAAFTSANGFAVNAFAVVALGALGVVIASGRPRLLRAAVPAVAVFCLADWVLVQDFGIPGGLGTDPNSMVPWLLLLWGGYLAVTRAVDLPERTVASRLRPAIRLPEALADALAAVSARGLVAVGAVGVTLVGAAPMASAAVNRNADPIIARAIAGTSARVDRQAPGFRLTGQSGQQVTLASLHGKVVLLTFIDPVCPGCSGIAQEMRSAGTLLGGGVEFVAIAASSMHAGPAFISAFDQRQGLTTMPNWLFLTGSVAQLQQVWSQYEQIVPHLIGGMTAYSDVVFVIDKSGRIREEVKDGPGPGTTPARSSFAVLLSDAARQVA